MEKERSTKTWQVGSVAITRIQEREAPVPADRMLADVTPETVLSHPRLQPHFADGNGLIRFAFNSFVIEAGSRRILVDTCAGNDKPRPGSSFDMLDTAYLDDLQAAGFDPDQIDTVVSTHLHVDHVGWNTRLENGHWVPTFPVARYLFESRELAHWANAGPQHWGDVFGDSIQPILDAGLADMVEAPHSLTEEVSLEPTPGHTPGHVCVRIKSGGEEAIITGDVIHHPIQLADTAIRCAFDHSSEEAAETRRSFVNEMVASGILVLGSHFADPTGGRIVADGDAYHFEPA